MTEVNVKEFKKDYLNGLKYKELMDKYNITQPELQKLIRHNKLTRTKSQAQIGNQNSVGNNGGAKENNKNAVTTGEYETIFKDVLTEEELEVYNIVDFQDYNSLNKVGSNLYTGEGATATNNYTVKNMQIEGSNVDIIQSTADLMSNLRAFEANQKVVQIMDSTLSKIANEIGTVR